MHADKLILTPTIRDSYLKGLRKKIWFPLHSRSFCKLFALYFGKCYGEAIVKSDADFHETSTQRTLHAELWIGRDVSSICRILSVLHWKTSHNCHGRSLVGKFYARFHDKTVYNVFYDCNTNADTPWSSSFSGSPRGHLLQLLLVLSNIC